MSKTHTPIITFGATAAADLPFEQAQYKLRDLVGATIVITSATPLEVKNPLYAKQEPPYRLTFYFADDEEHTPKSTIAGGVHIRKQIEGLLNVDHLLNADDVQTHVLAKVGELKTSAALTSLILVRAD